MVDNYRPGGRRSSRTRLDELEDAVFDEPKPTIRPRDPRAQARRRRRCAASSRRSATSSAGWRAASSPRSREALAYRFRDVYDHLVRLADEATLFQDRVTALLDAHLSIASNRLNQVMKVLTIISTIFMPLTVLTGMYGMNVHAAASSRRRGRAVLVDRSASWSRIVGRDAVVLPPVQCRLSCLSRDPPAAAGARQPDRRRRGRRAAGLGRQGAGRERHRRRRASHRDRHRARRQDAGPRRGRRRRHGAGGRRARAASATRPARSRRRRRSRRHPHARASAARRCRRSRRCRASCCGRGARGSLSGTEIRVDGGAAAPPREVGAPEGTLHRGRRPVLQPAGAPQVPQGGRRRVGADLAPRDADRARLLRGRRSR